MQSIAFEQLAFILIPVVLVFFFLWRWTQESKEAGWSIARMLVQLLLVGYVLTYLFERDSAWVVLSVLVIMVVASSWIALRTVKQHRYRLFKFALLSVLFSGTGVLALVTQGVLHLSPWYDATVVIPLAGMIFASAMNSVSLCSERLYKELNDRTSFLDARAAAYRTAMVPTINAMFAVGLVSLPGMMTGQILSGVSPLIAARYQIMVMGMIFAAAGLASALFLLITRSTFVSLSKSPESES